MKLVTKEDEKAHYDAVLKGGAIGGFVGLGLGLGGVMLASRRYTAFRQLTLPFRTFLVTSSATFGAIVQADRSSIAFERGRDPMRQYRDQASLANEEAMLQKTRYERFMDWGRENRYPVVFGTWLVGMGAALSYVGRDKYSTATQKLVQARVYAQGLTLAVLLLTAIFELGDAKTGTGRWETVKMLDPEDPEHKRIIEKKIHKEAYEGQDLWKDMVAAEERRMAAAAKKKEVEAS